MYWQEEKITEGKPVVPDDVVDLAFDIQCRTLPVDHAWALSEAVIGVLPWIAEEERTGVHTIHVAESGNGWMRPAHADDLLYLSRRTRLTLRLSKDRIEDAKKLTGATLSVAGNPMHVGEASVRPLGAAATIFARYVVTEENDEDTFMRNMLARLEVLGVHPRKMLCGIEHAIATPSRTLRTRSLMLAELPHPASVLVQQRGLGPERRLGCGLFIPHKGIKEIGQPAE